MDLCTFYFFHFIYIFLFRLFFLLFFFLLYSIHFRFHSFQWMYSPITQTEVRSIFFFIFILFYILFVCCCCYYYFYFCFSSLNLFYEHKFGFRCYVLCIVYILCMYLFNGQNKNVFYVFLRYFVILSFVYCLLQLFFLQYDFLYQ